jgi:hypothetical protein
MKKTKSPDGQPVLGDANLPGFNIVAKVRGVWCYVEWLPTATEALRNCARRPKVEEAYVVDDAGNVVKGKGQ